MGRPPPFRRFHRNTTVPVEGSRTCGRQPSVTRGLATPEDPEHAERGLSQRLATLPPYPPTPRAEQPSNERRDDVTIVTAAGAAPAHGSPSGEPHGVPPPFPAGHPKWLHDASTRGRPVELSNAEVHGTNQSRHHPRAAVTRGSQRPEPPSRKTAAPRPACQANPSARRALAAAGSDTRLLPGCCCQHRARKAMEQPTRRSSREPVCTPRRPPPQWARSSRFPHTASSSTGPRADTAASVLATSAARTTRHRGSHGRCSTSPPCQLALRSKRCRQSLRPRRGRGTQGPLTYAMWNRGPVRVERDPPQGDTHLNWHHGQSPAYHPDPWPCGPGIGAAQQVARVRSPKRPSPSTIPSRNATHRRDTIRAARMSSLPPTCSALLALSVPTHGHAPRSIVSPALRVDESSRCSETRPRTDAHRLGDGVRPPACEPPQSFGNHTALYLRGIHACRHTWAADTPRSERRPIRIGGTRLLVHRHPTKASEQLPTMTSPPLIASDACGHGDLLSVPRAELQRPAACAT